MTDQQLNGRIEEILDSIRPNLQMDGGDVSFVNFQDGIVYLRLEGACIGCPSAMFSTKIGIEDALKDQLSDVHEVSLVDM